MNKTALIIPDCHFPYADYRAYNLMLKVAKSLPRLDSIVLLGDYADFYALNSHGKHSGLIASLKAEVDTVNEQLDELDELFPRAKKTYLEGNHCYRLSRFIDDRAPELFGTFNCESLFRLRSRGNWQWIPYTPDQKHKVLGSKLYARHEPVGGGANVANSTVTKCGGSVIFGHCHRIQEYQTVMIDGSNHRGISCGWLGDKEHKVMNYVKNHHQWALGFSIVTVLPDKTFFANTVHIIDNQCTFGSKVFKG